VDWIDFGRRTSCTDILCGRKDDDWSGMGNDLLGAVTWMLEDVGRYTSRDVPAIVWVDIRVPPGYIVLEDHGRCTSCCEILARVGLGIETRGPEAEAVGDDWGRDSDIEGIESRPMSITSSSIKLTLEGLSADARVRYTKTLRPMT
jgi:hypothetical protein